MNHLVKMMLLQVGSIMVVLVSVYFVETKHKIENFTNCN